MEFSAAAPPDWDRRSTAPALSREFASAMGSLGWRPRYAADDRDAALVLLRRLPVPGLGAWTARAKLYLQHGHEPFVHRLLARLAAEGVGYVVLGDSARPMPGHLRGALPGLTLSERHIVVHDAGRPEDAMLAEMDPVTRKAIRKAARAEVRVTEVVTDADLRAYCRLAEETAARIRQRDLVAALPEAFFSAVFRTMVPRGTALFVLARLGDAPVAGALFLKSPDRLKYFHGVSTRDPALAPCQGPTAIVWHAMRLAHRAGIPCFDHGAVTVTDDHAHPHYSVYLFKRRFGGRVEALVTGDLVLSRVKHAFQEHVMMPLWKHLHPFYIRVAGRPAVARS